MKTQVKGKDVGDGSLSALDIEFATAAEKTVLIDNDSIVINDSTNNSTKRSKLSSLVTYLRSAFSRYALFQELSSLTEPVDSTFRALYARANGMWTKNSAGVEARLLTNLDTDYFKNGKQVTYAYLNNTTDIPEGAYRVENEAIPGLPGNFFYIQHWGNYSGTGYSVQSLYCFQNGINQGWYIRNSVAGAWQVWERQAKFSDIPTTLPPTPHDHAEVDIQFADIVTGNASGGMHGFLPKLPMNNTKFMNGMGAWAVPTSTPDHTHTNKTILDAISSAFTTTLKSAYDIAVTHISDAVKHITSTERYNWNSAFGWGNHSGLYRNKLITINEQFATSYSLKLTDIGGLITFQNASPVAVNIPNNATVPFPIGTQIDTATLDKGKITFSGSGVSIFSKDGNFSLGDQYVGATLIKLRTDTWLLIGDLIA